ncbi:hypothetical protein D3C87_2174360 [compost metagenome]
MNQLAVRGMYNLSEDELRSTDGGVAWLLVAAIVVVAVVVISGLAVGLVSSYKAHH